MRYALFLPFLLMFACGAPADEAGQDDTPEAATTNLAIPAAPVGDYADAPTAIGIVTSDIEASIQFYQDILGFKPTGGFEIDGQFGRELGLVKNGAFSVTTFTTGDQPSAVTFKLVSFFDPVTKQPAARAINEATGVQYLTLMVNDIEPILQRLQQAGIIILSKEGMTVGQDKNQDFVLVQDPDGVFIELIEIPR